MASRHHAVLLANHGPVVAGKTLADAAYTIAALEETAKLFLPLKGCNTSSLTASQVAVLKPKYPPAF